MKKVYRRSQITKIVGRPIFGMEMHKFGLPYLGAGGSFSNATGEGSIDLMLAAVDCYYPNIHTVSLMPNGTIFNRFIEGATLYRLFTGNCDPDLEFTNEFSYSDFTKEELSNLAVQRVDIASSEPTLEDQNAIPWQLKKTF